MKGVTMAPTLDMPLPLPMPRARMVVGYTSHVYTYTVWNAATMKARATNMAAVTAPLQQVKSRDTPKTRTHSSKMLSLMVNSLFQF